MNPATVESRVEALCQRGCAEVLQIISALEQGNLISETADLSEEERRAVLAELKTIMAPYRGRKFPA